MDDWMADCGGTGQPIRRLAGFGPGSPAIASPEEIVLVGQVSR